VNAVSNDEETSEMTPTHAAPTKRTLLGSRIVSVAALFATVCGVAYLAKNIYHIATDSFVVPVVLSPDSDLVIQSTLSRAALLSERMKVTSQREQIEAELYAAEQAIDELKALQMSVGKSLDWTAVVTQSQAAADTTELEILGRQRTALTTMLAAQEAVVARAKTDLDAGLLSVSEYTREENAVVPMRVAIIENERARLLTQTAMDQVLLTKRAMSAGRGPTKMTTPEMLGQQDQLVRIKCDLLKLEAERRTKTAERRRTDEELAKLDELLAQLNKRPIFRAIDASTNVAFIPYTQIDGVSTGGKVYECVLGVFSCTEVGRVTEVLPGEVIVPDPWGSPARGQYAVIALDDQHAAQSKTLRVRPSAGSGALRTPKPTSLASK
jgi:hypothetical protein